MKWKHQTVSIHKCLKDYARVWGISSYSIPRYKKTEFESVWLLDIVYLFSSFYWIECQKQYGLREIENSSVCR